jgi:iron complex outermembrane receptor protein
VAILLLGTSACWVAGHAWAQPGSDQASSPATGSAATDQAPTATLQEVVVTAERRVTDLQKTPVAVNTVTQNTLTRAGAVQLTGIGLVMPDVQVTTAIGATYPTIRGLGAGPSDPSVESNNAVYVDGVILDKLRGLEGFFFDISGVEVDKGPQGTLFGRDANGGALRITTNAPVLGKMSAEGELEAGSYDTRRATGYLNLPIGDTFAVRGAFLDYSHNGYMLSGIDADNQKSARVSALWQPNASESLKLVVDSSLEIGGASTGSNIVGVLPGITNVYVPSNPRDDTFYVGKQKSQTTPFGIQSRQQGFLLENIYNFRSVAWTTVLGHRQMDEDPDTYPGNFGQGPAKVAPNGGTYASAGLAYTPQWYDSYSLESRFNSTGNSALQWVAGIYADHYTDGGTMISYADPSATNNPQIQIAQPDQTNESWAAFAQGTYSPGGALDGLHLTLGGRLTEEVKNASNTFTQFGLIVPYAALVPYTSDRWGSGTYRAAVAYDLTNTSMIYADTATGFTAGGIGYGPGINPAVGPVFQPQRNTAYEFGSKNRFLHNTLQVNLEAWLYDYRDIVTQVTEFQAVGPGVYGGLPVLTTGKNVGAAYYRGVTLDIQYLITPNDRLTANFTRTHNKYGDYVVTPTPGMSLTPGPLTAFNDQLAHSQIAGIPAWNGYTQYMHTWPQVLGGSLNAEVDAQLQGRTYAGQFLDSVYGNLSITNGGWAILNASVQYQPKDANWSVTLYDHNLANRLIVNKSENPSIHAWTGSFNTPRILGVILNAKLN